MKKLLVALILLSVSASYAAPPSVRLVCDPQAGVTSYAIETVGLGAVPWFPAMVSALPDGSINVDLSAIPNGSYSILVSACAGIGADGAVLCSDQAPFSFTALHPVGATGIKIKAR